MGFFIFEDNKGNEYLRTGRVAAAIAGGLALFIGICMFIASITIIRAGERGIVLTWGAFNGEIFTPGLHFRVPIMQKVVKTNVQTRVISFDAEGEYQGLAAASKDLQDVAISVVANYHVDDTRVGQIYKEYGLMYEENILMPIIRETVKSVSAQFTAEELVTKRTEFADKINVLLTERFTSKLAVFERANITNLTFSPSFKAAIEAKVTAEQDALAQKNKLEQVKYEAQQKIETAKADAESIRIQGDALSKNPALVQLKWVEKWDGVMPHYMMGNSTPLINIPAAQ